MDMQQEPGGVRDEATERVLNILKTIVAVSYILVLYHLFSVFSDGVEKFIKQAKPIEQKTMEEIREELKLVGEIINRMFREARRRHGN